MSRAWKASGPALAMLRNAQRGLPLTDGLRGRSQFGGSTRTEWSLRRQGLLDGGVLSEAGKEFLSKLDGERG